MKKIKKLLVSMAALVVVSAVTSVTVWAENKEKPDDPFDLRLVFSSQTQLDVYVDNVWSAGLSDTYAYGETVRLTAPSVSNKTFSHWEADGSIISYNEELKMTLNANTTLHAVYANSAPTEKPVVSGFTSITRSNEGDQIVLQAIAGATYDNVGIVYSTTATGNNLKIGNNGVTNVKAEKLNISESNTGTIQLPACILDDNNCWTFRLKPDKNDTTYNVRTYVQSGDTTTYGDIKEVQLSKLNSGISLITDPNSFDPGNESINKSLNDLLKNVQMYTVTFDANGGTGSMAPQALLNGTELKHNTFTHSDYNFSGWNTKADGSGMAYSDEQKVTLNKDTTLYAQWQKKGSSFTDYTIAEKSGITYHVYADHAEVAEASTNLTTADIVSEIEGQAVTTIGENAFNSCKQLTEVKIPDSVTEIDANAFWGCTSLESLTIPKTVTTIDKTAFSHCTAFKTIYGYTGSAAETFAKANNIEFVALDAQSEETLGIAKAPTVDEKGVVSWSPVENAVKYRIVKEYDGKTYLGKKTTETSYQQNNTNVLDEHKIYIRSYDADGNYTNGEILTVPAKVGIAKAPTVDSDGVITWKPVQNAVTYKIVKEYGGKTYLGKETMELSYQQNNVPIVEYKVYIRAFGEDGSYTNGEVRTVPEKAKRLGTAKAPTVDSDGVVSWKSVTNASKYVVVKVVDGKKYYGKSTTETSYKFANKPRKDYRVYVLTYDETGNYTVGQEAEVELPLGYVDDVTVDANGNVSWTAARNAVKYKVGKTVNGKTYYTGELTTNSATIKVPKSDYKVFVVAFDKDGNRTWGKKLNIKA